MSRTRTLTQSTTAILEPAHSPSQQLDTRHTPDAPSEFQPRRSHRTRRPSAHKLESDEYEADSQASTRPPTPSGPKSKSTAKSNSKSKPRKRRREKPGDRPGCIVQPDVHAWSESYEGSPEPLAAAGPDYGDSRMASPGPASDPLEAVGRAEALRRTSAVLGDGASRLSTKTLKKVLAAIEDYREETPPSPMEIEGGGTPAVAQSPGRVVLGSRYQPPAGEIADGADYPQGPGEQSAARNSHAPEHSRLEANDTATESEPESEVIELGPGDSVSQRVPPVLRAPSLNPHPAPILHTPNHAKEAGPTSTRTYLDAAAVDEDESDTSSNTNTEAESENELESVRARKRQRLPPSPRQSPLPPRPQSSRPTLYHTQHPRSHTHTVTNSSRTQSSTTHPSLSCLSLSKPPPTSDIDAVLEWAARFAKHSAANQGGGVPRHVTQAGPSTNNYELLATVLDDLRHSRPIPSEPLSFRNLAERPSLHHRRAELVENDTAVLEAEAALALGKHVRQRHQATLSDFPGFPRHIATLAIPKVIATAITEGAYETYGVTSNMANKCFATIWERELPDIRLQKPPPALTGLIVHRVSWFRGKATGNVRSVITTEYDFVNPVRTPQDVRHNKRLAKRLLPNTFHCKGLKTDVEQYEHSALPRAIAVAYFWAPDVIGAVHHNMFYPLPLPAVAMALTIMQHCIMEWKTGRFLKTVLNVSTQLNMYQCHLKGLLEYGKPAGRRLVDFQKDWFWYGMDYAGATQDDDEPYQAITRADRVRADTPVPDYAEPPAGTRGPSSAVADVRHVSSAKGKGRATH